MKPSAPVRCAEHRVPLRMVEHDPDRYVWACPACWARDHSDDGLLCDPGD